MNYGEIKQYDIANGTGVRVTIFVSGCTHHCEGCFNQMTWDFDYGFEFTQQTQSEILKYLEPDYISGLTLLGGEPMEISNQRVLVNLLKDVKEKFPKKDVWCYTGYTLESDLLEGSANCEVTMQMLKYIDVLVDGEFVLEKKNISLPFRGSENQRIIDLPKTLKNGRVILKNLEE